MAQRQAELMESVYSAKEAEVLAALWAEDPTGAAVAAAYSSGGPHAADFLLPPRPGAPGDKVFTMPEDEFLTALRALKRIPHPAFLPRFRRERGPAQQCNHQYSTGSKVCGHSLIRADGAADKKGVHQQLCMVGGGVDKRHDCLRNWTRSWLDTVCHVPWAGTEQHVPEWDEWVQAKCATTGELQFRTVETPAGPKQEPVMVVKQARLDVGFRDDEGVLGYVDVTYVNAVTMDAATTLRSARTAGKAASEKEDQKRRRYPAEKYPHAELIPFVVEARGRLGSEVLPFLRQHAPADEPHRSAVLARATREISIITQRGLASLLLAAEPRPAVV